MSAPSFVSETEIAERKKKRQEEWEKVRRDDEPLEAPEEVYDHRSLFDRLEEQKEKKQLEWEEAHRLKNMVKGLEDDEVEFLDLVDRTREKMDRELKREEEKVLLDYKEQVIQLNEKEEKEKRPKKPVTSGSKGLTQKELLKGAVKRKGASIENGAGSPKQAKVESSSTNNSEVEHNQTPGEIVYPSALTVAGVLPGIGEYTDSSDSDSSASSDPETYLQPRLDLMRRNIMKCGAHIISQLKASRTQ